MFKQVIVLSALVGLATCLPDPGALESTFNQHQQEANPEGQYYDRAAQIWAEEAGPAHQQPAVAYPAAQENAYANQAVRQTKAGLGGHLRSLARTVSRNSKRALDESKPVFNDIRTDLNQRVHQVRSHPSIQRGMQVVTPHIGALKKRAEPIMARGGKMISDAVSKAGNRVHLRQQRPQVQPFPAPQVPEGSYHSDAYQVDEPVYFAHPPPPNYDDVAKPKQEQH